MDEPKTPLVLRTTYEFHTPELWNILKRDRLAFGGQDYSALLESLPQEVRRGAYEAATSNTHLTFNLRREVQKDLAKIAEQIPNDEELAAWRESAIFESLEEVAGHSGVYSRPPFSKEFWHMIDDACRAADQRARDVVGELCWRLGICDGPSTLRSFLGRVRIGSESIAMRGLPMVSVFTPFISREEHQVSEERLQNVIAAMQVAAHAPVHHQLLQEAWRHRWVDPRVGIVMGVAAAEAAVKSLVATLMPGTRWMLENLPAPPIGKIISEQLPLLKGKNSISGMILIPHSIRSSVRKYVELRNQIVHGRGGVATYEDAFAVLDTVRNLICLTDFYAGETWALELLPEKIRTEVLTEAENKLRNGIEKFV